MFLKIKVADKIF